MSTRAPIQEPLNIFLLGDPAAGKATQAELLLKRFPLYDLDMGKELRLLKARNKKIRQLLEATYDKGNLTQTDLVRGIHKQRVFSTPKKKGILFDGNPKMVGEARLIQKWMKQVGRGRGVLVYLSIPMNETVQRMTGRVEYYKGKFSRRTDDNQAALKNRVKYYRKNITAVVQYLRTLYPYKKISGLGSVQAVNERILKFISEYQK